MDHNDSGSVSYSEWLCALAYIDQLTLVNLRNLFKFILNQDSEKVDLKTLERSYRPHMFRLEIEKGKEK